MVQFHMLVLLAWLQSVPLAKCLALKQARYVIIVMRL
jgi:hypothetical protein